MQKTTIEEISFEEFQSKLSDVCIVSTLGTIVSTSYEEKIEDLPPCVELDGITAELQTEDLLDDFADKKERKKQNRLSDGVTFGRVARSRSASKLVGRAYQLRKQWKDGELLEMPNSCFLTLTFPYAQIMYDPKLHDQIFCSCVQKLVKKWRAENKIYDILWIAERHTQSERHPQNLCEFSAVGRLHFHAVVFFYGYQDVQQLNKDWLSVLKNCKSVKFPLQNKDGKDYQPLDAEWLHQENLQHSIDYLKLLTYVNKYVKKQAEYETDEECENVLYCRCWGCSRGVSGFQSKMYYTKQAVLPEFKEKIKQCYKVVITISRKECVKCGNSYIEIPSESHFEIYVAQIDWKYINSAFLKEFMLVN